MNKIKALNQLIAADIRRCSYYIGDCPVYIEPSINLIHLIQVILTCYNEIKVYIISLFKDSKLKFKHLQLL
jgi:hypothetical protein